MDFCCDKPAPGTHGLLAIPLAAAEPPSLVDSGISAITSDDLGLTLQHTWISIWTSLWASRTRMRMRKG